MKDIMLTIADTEEDTSVAISAGVDSHVICSSSPCACCLPSSISMQTSVTSRSTSSRVWYGEIAHNKLEALTMREMEIVEFVKQGLSNKIIANKLKRSEHTVRNHISNIMKKLGLMNRVQLATMALKEDWRRHCLNAPLEEMAPLVPCI